MPLGNPKGLRLVSFISGDQGNSVPDKAIAVIDFDHDAKDEATFQEIAGGWAEFLRLHQATGNLKQTEAGQLHFSIAGKPAHGMEPFRGVNAGTLLALFLKTLSFEASEYSFLSLLSDILHEDHYGEYLHMACEDEVSGKLTAYHLPEHPVQQRILDVVEDLTGYPKEKIYMGTDGCGVPVHELPLANYAWAFAKLAKPEVISNPERQQAVIRVTDQPLFRRIRGTEWSRVHGQKFSLLASLVWGHD